MKLGEVGFLSPDPSAPYYNAGGGGIPYGDDMRGPVPSVALVPLVPAASPAAPAAFGSFSPVTIIGAGLLIWLLVKRR